MSAGRAESHDGVGPVQLHRFFFGQHSGHQNCEVSTQAHKYPSAQNSESRGESKETSFVVRMITKLGGSFPSYLI